MDGHFYHRFRGRGIDHNCFHCLFTIRRAQKQFELKAADLTLQTNDPVVSETKGREIDTLYPGTLPDGWREKFKAESFFSESDDLKSEVAKLLIEYLECKDQIVKIYGALFQESTTQDFLKRIRDLDSGSHKQPDGVQHSPKCKLSLPSK